jgi:ElaB/YqjD/DUF883 family membrane-anchored ribosome-binding protein
MARGTPAWTLRYGTITAPHGGSDELPPSRPHHPFDPEENIMAIQEESTIPRRNGPNERSASSGGSYTERAAGAVHEGVDRLKERIEPREEQLREAASSAQEKLRDAKEQARNQYGDLAGQTREYVREHPLTAAAVAFAAGVLLVSWLRR